MKKKPFVNIKICRFLREKLPKKTLWGHHSTYSCFPPPEFWLTGAHYPERILLVKTPFHRLCMEISNGPLWLVNSNFRRTGRMNTKGYLWFETLLVFKEFHIFFQIWSIFFHILALYSFSESKETGYRSFLKTFRDSGTTRGVLVAFVQPVPQWFSTKSSLFLEVW